MSEHTGIEWTDRTFNPWWGCTKVSPACDNCYAETLAERYGWSETGSQFPIWGKDATRRFFGDKHWAEPLKWDRAAEKEGVRKRVFCGSMCDVMEDARNRSYLWRADSLLETPFAVRGLSVEPLLGPIDSLEQHFTADISRGGCLISPGIDWVIFGGESGHGARPMYPDWITSIRDQCVSAGVSFFFKQHGEFAPVTLHDRHGKIDPNERKEVWVHPDGHVSKREEIGDFAWPMVRVGKKAAGRLLDWREWSEIPARALTVEARP